MQIAMHMAFDEIHPNGTGHTKCSYFYEKIDFFDNPWHNRTERACIKNFWNFQSTGTQLKFERCDMSDKEAGARVGERRAMHFRN